MQPYDNTAGSFQCYYEHLDYKILSSLYMFGHPPRGILFSYGFLWICITFWQRIWLDVGQDVSLKSHLEKSSCIKKNTDWHGAKINGSFCPFSCSKTLMCVFLDPSGVLCSGLISQASSLLSEWVHQLYLFSSWTLKVDQHKLVWIYTLMSSSELFSNHICLFCTLLSHPSHRLGAANYCN